MLKNKMSASSVAKILIILATLMWGVSFVVLKDVIESFPMFLVLSVRFFIGFVFLLLVNITKLNKLNKKNIIGGLIMGVLIFIAYIFQTTGLKETTPGKNAFLTATYCIMVPFISLIIFKEKINKYNIIGAIICVVGIGLISIDVSSEFNINIGDVLSIICGFFFAVHIVASTIITKDNDTLMVSIVQIFTLFFLSTLTTLIFEREQITFDFKLDGWLKLLYLGIGPSALCLTFQAYGNKHLNPTSLGILLSLESVFGVITSLIFGYDELNVLVFFGFVLVFSAIIISETKLNFLKNKKKSIS